MPKALLFHHQTATCKENEKFREVTVDLLDVNESVYCTEL